MSEQTQSASADTNPVGLVLRIIWSVGPFALPIVIGHIAINIGGDYSVMDGVYFAIAAFVILARFLDITKYEGTTTEGGRATMSHFYRYAGLVAVGSVALWAAGRWLAPYALG